MTETISTTLNFQAKSASGTKKKKKKKSDASKFFLQLVFCWVFFLTRMHDLRIEKLIWLLCVTVLLLQWPESHCVTPPHTPLIPQMLWQDSDQLPHTTTTHLQFFLYSTIGSRNTISATFFVKILPQNTQTTTKEGIYRTYHWTPNRLILKCYCSIFFFCVSSVSW